MAKKKKQAGVGAKASCFARFVHPSAAIRQFFPTNQKSNKLDNLLITGEDIKVVRRRSPPTPCFLFRHDSFPDQELYANKRNVVITEEGHPEHFFAAVVAPPLPAEQIQAEEQQATERIAGADVMDDALQGMTHGNLSAQDMTELQNQGITVDNDNLPVEENDIGPVAQAAETAGIDWTVNGLCKRRMVAAGQPKARFKKVDSSVVSKMTKLSLFQLLFPMEYLESVVIPETNKKLKYGPLSPKEFFVWLGLWLYMSCHVGIHNRRDWWSQKEINMEEGAPYRFNLFMSRCRFEDILQNLVYTNRIPPAGYKDPFFLIRQMEEAWNKNMEDQFDPSWINCLDESMMEWLSMFTCPGFMCVGRKPHPFGNERHTICCALSTIMWHAEIVEGKDRPSQLGPKEFNNLGGPTVGLMVRMTKPIHHTGKVVVMDSGFCVAKGIIEMEKKGVFGQALIKKLRYWPKFIPGDAIDQRFENKEVGDTEVGEVKIDTGEALKVFCFREPDYVMKIMASFGTLEENVDHKTRRVYQKNGQQVTKTFSYIEPISNHFKYRHQIDDHNNRRHAPISIEKTWATKHWPDRNFAWFIAVTEVNANHACAYFRGTEIIPQLEFRKNLAWEMINNSMEGISEVEDNSRMSLRHRAHGLVSLKPFRGRWCAKAKKFQRVKAKYQQQRCQNFVECRKQVRTYCKCSNGLFLCVACFAQHVSGSV